MSFPKSGKPFPRRHRPSPGTRTFARLVSTALKASLRGQVSSIKIVAGWTGANERTVKNWFAGSRAPSGDHFLGLAENSPAVLAAFLAAINRNDCLVMAEIESARAKVEAALVALEAVRSAHPTAAEVKRTRLPEPPNA